MTENIIEVEKLSLGFIVWDTASDEPYRHVQSDRFRTVTIYTSWKRANRYCPNITCVPKEVYVDYVEMH